MMGTERYASSPQKASPVGARKSGSNTSGRRIFRQSCTAPYPRVTPT